MSKIIKNYTFNVANKTITFNDYTSIEPEKIIRIVNLTRGNLIYDPSNGDFRGTVNGNVLTLKHDLAMMDNSDKLQIDYADTDISEYRLSDIDDASNPKYYGFLKTDGGWYILRENTTNKTYRYCRGDSGYSTAWTNRASQTYDYFDVIF